MIALLVSESNGDAARRAAAIIDGYLPRTGYRTWLGAISAEGLDDLRKALRKGASRATAVACHLMRGTRRSELAWVVGRRKAFSEDGAVAVATTTRRHRAEGAPGLAPLLAPLVGLGALFHDLGKLSDGFVAVLLKSVLGESLAQPVRHEFVSLLLLHEMVATSEATDDLDILRLLGDAKWTEASVIAAWSRLFGKYASLTGGEPNTEQSIAELLPDANQFPFLRAVADLVLTHHRLPEGVMDGADVDVTDAEHVSRWDAATVRRTKSHLTLSKSGLAELKNSNWLRCVAFDARLAIQALEAMAIGNRTAWTAGIATLARTALMLGDHGASHDKQPIADLDHLKGDQRKDAATRLSRSQAFANTASLAALPMTSDTEDGFESGAPIKAPCPLAGRVFGDTWWTHTRKVRRQALATLVCFAGLDRRLPGVAWDDQPAGLNTNAPGGSPFAWQGQAVAAVSEVTKRTKDGAALVFLLAGTGRGKTLAAMRVAAVGRRHIRVNCALGFRSLTLQTGDEYLDRVGFGPSQAVTMIGSDLMRRLHVADQRKDAADLANERTLGNAAAEATRTPFLTDGTDAEPMAEPDLGAGFESDAELPLAIMRACRDKPRAERMLAAPVLVSTIDMLMAAADPRRGRHLLATLRATTADLILDEIDSYEPEDASAICRLVELVAMAGRKVIAASATLSPKLAEALRLAYATGRRLRAGFLGLEAAFVVAWLSEHAQHAELDQSGPDNSEFVATHGAQVGLVTMASARGEVRRRAMLCDIEGRRTRRDVNTAVSMAALQLHEINRILDPATGRGVSVGLVRWNRTHSCRSFAARLMEEGLPGVRMAVLCTHARFPLAVRHYVDGFLRRLLTRKPDSDGLDPLLANDQVRTLLDDGGAEDVVILVSSSPLLERGRDLDFDYAIIEPCSEDVVTQTAGRVRRHRPGAWSAANIGLMSHSSDVMLNGNDKFDSKIQYPGIETTLPLYASHKDTAPWMHLTNRSSGGMFDMQTWCGRLDASGSLEPRSAASLLGERRRARVLLGEGANQKALHGQFDGPGRTAKLLSFSSYAGTPLRMLDTMHFRERRFRRQTGQERQYYRQDGRWVAVNPNDRNGDGAPTELSMTGDWNPQGTEWQARLLLSLDVFDVDTVAERLAEQLAASGEKVSWVERKELSTMAISFSGDRTQLKLRYHPVLGGDRKAIGEV